MPSGSKSYLFSGDKALKICHLVGLLKSQCYSLRFLQKAPTKNNILTEASELHVSVKLESVEVIF